MLKNARPKRFPCVIGGIEPTADPLSVPPTADTRVVRLLAQILVNHHMHLQGKVITQVFDMVVLR